MNFKPIATAPVSSNSQDQILCRFWYPYLGGHWVYFVTCPNGADTKHPTGGADPAEWCELPK